MIPNDGRLTVEEIADNVGHLRRKGRVDAHEESIMRELWQRLVL